MSHLRALPELVQDSQLDVTIQGHTTIHRAPLECRDSMSPQYWETVEPLGQGGDGMVFLQQKIRGPGNVENLAVKQMMLKADLTSEDHDSKRYLRELEALAKFAQGRVSYVNKTLSLRLTDAWRSTHVFSLNHMVGISISACCTSAWSIASTQISETTSKHIRPCRKNAFGPSLFKSVKGCVACTITISPTET